MEKTVKHFCTTAKRIRKDAVEFAKQATMIAGMSAMVVTKMELQRLKEKLPNISIRYTGTWKDTLRFNIGLATTAGGILLTLLGGGSEVISAGASTAVSVPAAASGIAIAGTGLAISGSALANMFDVRIQKSESNKGNGSGESGKETGTGTQGVGNPVKVEGRGSTARTIPNTLNEQMAMNQVQSNPLKNATKLPFEMKDSRWPALEGWVKMQSVVKHMDGSKTVIHFVYNEITGAFDDFKFK